MWRTSGIIAAALATLGAFSSLWAQQPASEESASVLLERGIFAEETSGDMDGAVKIYQQIIAQEKASRPFVAQAIYRMGACYAKKADRAKASEALSQVIKNFPDQVTTVAQAKVLLRRLALADVPRVVSSSPAMYADNVPASLTQIAVTFDRPMMHGSWSWTSGGETFPKMAGSPSYNPARTVCTVPVKLEPGKAYWIGVNSPDHRNFQTPARSAAAWTVIVFATLSADGKPTPIPEKMLAEAKSINAVAARGAPIAVKTVPQTLADNVDASLDKITATFDQEMMDRSWSWTGGGDTLPTRTGEVSYDATKRTCTYPTKLQPGKVYWIGVNSPRFRHFQSPSHVPAEPYVILFSTKSADGKPTPIPADLVAKAAAVNAGESPPSMPGVEVRFIGRKVADFPQAVDLTTPESACAAFMRASSRMDSQAIVDLSWVKVDLKDDQAWWKNEQQKDPEGLKIYTTALAEAGIAEVLTYKGDLAAVISYLPFPEGKGRSPYSLRSFAQIKGQWKNLGEDRLNSVEDARTRFNQVKDAIWSEVEKLQAAQLGTSGATSQPGAAIDRGDVRQVAEAFIAALAAGRTREAIGMTHPTAAVGKQIADMEVKARDQKVPVPEFDKARIESCHADAEEALVITNEVLGDPHRNTRGQFLLHLVKLQGVWIVEDLDIRDKNSAQANLADFLKKRPGAKPTPPSGQAAPSTQSSKQPTPPTVRRRVIVA